MPPRGGGRGGPPRGGAARGAPAGRGGPSAQPPRGAASNRARPPAPSQRMPPPPAPHPPAQDSYEDYVCFFIRKYIFWVCFGDVECTDCIFRFLSLMTRATQSQAMNPMTATTASHKRKLIEHIVLLLLAWDFQSPSFLKKINFAYNYWCLWRLFGNIPVS